MTDRVVTLDVRPDIQAGREPFNRIMKAASDLAMNQSLRIIAPFEPTPLYRVLARNGLVHQTTQTPNGDWEVLFFRETVGPAVPETTLSEKPASHDVVECLSNVVEVDARGLEPPQPMVAILESLPKLGGDGELRARTDRRPIHLFPQLEKRGFIGETEALPDGTYLTRIRHCP